ncbi:MAG TPA: hypothetical protein DD435_01465 [Cyanobacteria bacterium UBA8530]|nr:hypothetical protein [Cyanobacteria bacterium UBA8530]
MTVNLLANAFNVGAIALVLLMSFVVSRSHSLPFFAPWLKGYFFCFLVVAIALFFPIEGPSPFIFLEISCILGVAGFFFETGFQLQGKKRNPFVWRLLAAVFLFCTVLLFVGFQPKLVSAIPFAFSATAALYLGYLFMFEVKLFNRMTSALWLGLPLSLVFSSSIAYPLLPLDHHWMGFSFAATMHLLLGTGMIVFLLEKNKEEADRGKDEFLSVVSHEMRTPLNGIQGFASILEDEILGKLNEQQRQALSRILEGSEKLLDLVNDLLDVARNQAGKFDVQLEEIEYSSLVEEVMASLQPVADGKRISFSEEVEVSEPVSLDGKRIKQVLSNLLANALKFTQEGGAIEIRARIEGRSLVTEVRDDGLGISREDLPKLFAPFKQLDMGLTRRVGGVGLGLCISKAIVEAHGGRIEGSSPGKDKGSTFRFVLPVS